MYAYKEKEKTVWSCTVLEEDMKTNFGSVTNSKTMTKEIENGISCPIPLLR